MANLTVPSNYYILKSGPSKGKSPSLLMFQNPDKIDFLYKKYVKSHKRSQKKNLFHLQLEWLIQQGENRKTKMLCPHCKKKTVKYFSIRTSYSGKSIGRQYTYCEDCAKPNPCPRCILHEFKFSVLANIDAKENRIFFKKAKTLYCTVFELPKRLTKERIFEFFKS